MCLVSRKELDSIEQHEKGTILREKTIHAVQGKNVLDPESALQHRNSLSIEYGIVENVHFVACSILTLQNAFHTA